ncbi:MAG TPA: DNA repair protein RadA [Crocinitomicaceae bacterium]|nr:DNA repair protein RadA [Flavobacteriales bacterium]HBW86907.1 DNA repair protein RadA [Crocinitomicaceae bacterium]
MSKVKSAFFCQECGYETPKWLGKCPSCQSWTSFVEEKIEKNSGVKAFSVSDQKSKPTLIQEVEQSEEFRLQFEDKELNTLLGGGLVPGSILLLGGEPGIGKSTLLLQIAVLEQRKVLYVSGEESDKQIRMRADRIGIKNQDCYLLPETNLNTILNYAQEIKPELLVIDSIQTLFDGNLESSPGSISQVRECTAQLLRFAKQTGTPVFLIGHITKDGSIAGPKVLEHMVDTVLQFEGDRNHLYRLLRTTKNRFGSTNELGIYEMLGAGLRAVDNPSELLINQDNQQLSGIAIASTIEGLRPLQIEVQALVSTAAYGTPQRSSTGFDAKRLNMLLAVLEKRCGFKLASKDVFLNIAGGIKVDDPATDLAVAMAVLSSNADLAIPKTIAFAAEIGLSGELRQVQRLESRVAEAEKLGYEKIIVSRQSKEKIEKNRQIQIIHCSKIEEVVRNVFG